jgi:putative oxidoreductase
LDGYLGSPQILAISGALPCRPRRISMTQLTSSPDHPGFPVGLSKGPSRSALLSFVSTNQSVVPTLLRVGLGGVIFGHGLQKVFGWFGGYGIRGTMSFFNSIGVPSLLGALVIVSDFFGSLALMAGLLTRFSAAAAAAVMLGAVLLVHLPNGFFMNWGGAAHGEGYELHLLALSMAASLIISGGGRASLDGWLARHLQPTNPR